ncbi:MAG: glutaminyl-peptide cyclotransferase, partial [Dokdonia sp.]
MTLYKSLTLFSLALLAFSCGGKKNLDNNYSIATTAVKNSMVNGGAIALSVKAKKNYVIDSIVYSLDDIKVASTTQSTNFKTNLKSPTLGAKTLKATIYTQEGTTVASQQIN